MEKTKEELFSQYVALDQLGAVVDRVQRYHKILSMKDDSRLEKEEKIWMLAYKGLELEFKPGTEESLLKAGQLTVLVDSIIPSDFK